jgi:ubiquitin-conjugating enzyme E2 C
VDQTQKAPVTIDMTIKGVPGPEWVGGQVTDRLDLELRIVVTADYPHQKPIVRWKTPIFHPNIMQPEDGGYVCTALLDRWNFRSTLVGFVQAIEVLLVSPNPDNPYDTDSCTRAARHFRKHPYSPDLESPGDSGTLRIRPVGKPPKVKDAGGGGL